MSHSQPKTRTLHVLILALFFLFLSLCALLGQRSNPVAYAHSAGGAGSFAAAQTLDAVPTGFGTIPLSAITLTKQVSQFYVKPGERVTYTLQVSSVFTRPVSVRLTDTLPSALSAVNTLTATQGTPIKSAGLITWTATISPQQVISISYSAVVTGVAEDHTITNQVMLKLDDSSLRTAMVAVLVKTRWKLFLPVLQKPFPLPVMTNGNFDAGPHVAGWTETSAKFKNTLIVAAPSLPSSVTPRSPTYVAWLGGQDNEQADLAQTVFIPPGYPTLKLHYFYWIASLDNQCGGNSDVGHLLVNNTERKTFDLCKTNNTNGWQEGFITVAEYAKQTVTFHFDVALDNAQNSNLFIDDVSFCTNCGQ